MFRRLLRRRPPGEVVHRIVRGRDGLIVGLHGYGSDERQLETLLPTTVPATTVVPRAPFPVEPGYGWWLPEQDGGALQLAPAEAVATAVLQVVSHIESAQRAEGFGPDQTVLVGYSQGAALALTVAARCPELVGAVVTGAGALVLDDEVRPSSRPMVMLVMNGSLDPVVTESDHTRTVEAFRRAGHSVIGRRDPVPHVIDESQAEIADRFLMRRLIASSPSRLAGGS